MKTKLQLLIISISLVIAHNESYGCDAPPIPFEGTFKIDGPSSVCSGETATYSFTTLNACLRSAVFSVENGGSIPGAIYSDGNFRVEWVNNTGSPITGKIHAFITYYDLGCDPRKGSKTKTETESVTIKPNTIPNTPNPISISQSRDEYTFSTFSSNATYYEWTSSGGTVLSTTDGPSLRVRSTGCRISVSVRAVQEGCDGSLQYSFNQGARQNISIPATPSRPYKEFQFDGRTGVYRVNAVPGATSYEWRLTGSGLQVNYSTSISANVICNNSTASGSLSVRAKNSCGASVYSSSLPIACSSFGCPTLLAGGKTAEAGTVVQLSGDEIEDVPEDKFHIVPNSVAKGSEIQIFICFPLTGNANDGNVYLRDSNGNIEAQYTSTNGELLINTSNLTTGIYFLSTTISGQLVTKRLVVE